MKKEIIKTQDYLLVVDDSEIKRGDYGFITSAVMSYDAMLKEWNQPLGSKVIAHLPLNDSPILEGVPLLPPLEQEDDVEKLAEEEYPIIPNTSPNVNWDRANKQEGFERGYNKARESERNNLTPFKNLIVLIENGLLKGIVETNLMIDQEISICKEYLNKLSQPKTPTHFEFEMGSMTIDEIREQGKGFLHASTFKIKTTNSQGQQVACGKYIY